MIKPFVIGSILFSHNIVQGPLAGISCAPFRALSWRYSKPAFSCTEMISCKTLVHQKEYSHRRYVVKYPEEGPVCFQLSGNDENDLAEAVKMVTDYGADLIDLNCGCPVKKIRSKGAGSSLLLQPTQLYKLICTMKNNTQLPVSIKIRVEGNSNDQFNLEIANVVKDAGADFLVVHGRHWTEHYETPCHYEDIQFFVETLSIPVIGNGDVACPASLRKMLATGCAGVMIGRAGVGQPWLIRKLIAEMNQEEFTMPSSTEIGMVFIEHVKKLSELLENEKFAVLQARKFAKYYARDMENRLAFSEAVQRCEKLIDLEKICGRFFCS